MVPGDQIGAYRVVQQIGEGGMGSVWLAEHTMLGRRAAIKVLHGEYSRHPEIVKRFFNEARAATAVSDPGIVQIFDFGNHTDGSAYIVMELLEGETLDKRLAKSGGRMTIVDSLRIMRQVASSLGAAHARGIIHRDLKPENIFLVRDPEVAGGERAKIVDFGIAKLAGDTYVKTATRAVMGTPQFMSPEQCQGAANVDARSDVYALGCVLFMLLVGRPPFDGAEIGNILIKQMKEATPVPSSVVPGIPGQVDALVLNCLAKEAGHRFASGTELAAAIGDLLANVPAGGRGITQPPPNPRPMTQPPPISNVHPVQSPPTTLSSIAGNRAPTAIKRGKSNLLLGIAGAVVVAGGVATFLAMRGGSDSGGGGDDETTKPAASPHARLMSTMKDVMGRFVQWSSTHAGAPCPTLAALGGGDDPWGHPLSLTCSDQPATQQIGLISAGPDGKLGTDDDIASWTLTRDVVELVRGPRWGTK
jgi:serine/threonine-protein kinase